MSYLFLNLLCLFSVANAMLRSSSSLLLKKRVFRFTPVSLLHGAKNSNNNVDNNAYSKMKPNFKSEIESKYFEFDRLEKEVYTWWETNGYFKPKINSIKKPFIIPMPPPNVTGYLHMGHALFVAIQDILTRFHRMRGRPTLWLPGTDHAGIATQLLVERSLTGEGITRQQLGREKFLERVWKWKDEKGGYITQQMRRLGASADWSREKFTLDDDMSEAVTEAFVRLHEQGLVYRGSYLVNWSPHLQTAVSDLEVEYSEETGTLFHFRYPLADNSGDFIPVATTRPETILGDTAVCVHPEDPRYQKFIGKMVKVPMTDRQIPVIADEVVEREFGTGALKITPAHDPNDYETGKRHNLPLINIMNRDASINAAGGERYSGLDRFDCRQKIWEDLTAAGLAIKADPHVQRVPRSQRGGEVIEPLVSAQWFVRTEGMAKRALDVVHSGEMKILPERFEKVWDGWLENIRDWCVSRQLWWGHRIPVYYVDGSSSEFIVARSLDEAHVIARRKYGRDVTLQQDEDVLDTWFSSGLWPFATVGWPHVEGKDASAALVEQYKLFYPATVMETGYDILFFWVARMVMLGLQLTDRAPFETVYLHGLVRDAEGQKMSKTKGNVIDPIDTIERVGCDSLRYSLVTGSTPGQDIPLSMERIDANRNFMNKLWNMGKYVQNSLSQLSEAELLELKVLEPMSSHELASLPLPERAIVHNLHQLVIKMTHCLETFALGEAGQLAYEFLWDELADWYVEISKTRMRDPVSARQARRVLSYVWDTSLRLLHPYAPFLTETLWQQLPQTVDSIMIADWPLLRVDDSVEAIIASDTEAAEIFQQMQRLVRGIRNVRAEYKTEQGRKLPAAIRVSVSTAAGARLLATLQQETASLSLLGRMDDTSVHFIPVAGALTETSFSAPTGFGQCVQVVIDEGLEVYIPLSGMIDREKELSRLGKQVEKLNKDIATLQARLSSDGFVGRAPESVVLEVKSNLREKQEQLLVVEKSLVDIQSTLAND